MKAKSDTLDVSICPDTKRAFLCRPGEDGNVAEVFNQGATGAHDNAFAIARRYNSQPVVLKALRKAEEWLIAALDDEPEDYDNKALKRDLKQIRKAIDDATV